MGDPWTRQRVLQTAPDAASAKAGEGLASPRKWGLLGRSEAAVWGECQGSGAKPYQVQVHLGDVAFKCSCPSRKFPCKHGIGLMLIHADGGVAEAAQPEWVTQWLASRAEKQVKKAEKAADVSPEKQAERAESQEARRAKRLENIAAGMSDLQLWLEDFVRAGLATAPTRGFAYYEERARRLIDAQAPGAARLVREIGSAASSGAAGEGWQRRTLEAAAQAYLLTQAVARLDGLPPDLQEDVKSVLGIPTPAEKLESEPVVQDVWQVIGREVEVEANLKTQWTYLYGVKSQRPAVLLDFAYGNAGLGVGVPTGVLFPAELAFYPGRSLRAGVRNGSQDVAPLTALRGLESIASLLRLHAGLLAEHPWLTSVAAPLTGARILLENSQWWVVDSTREALPLHVSGRKGWIALAVSAGGPVDVAVSTDGRMARLLSVVADGVFTDLATSPKEAA
jgi:SWIM zinc finger